MSRLEFDLNGICRHDVHKGTKSHEMLMNPIEMLMNLTKLKVVTMTTSETLSWSKIPFFKSTLFFFLENCEKINVFTRDDNSVGSYG